MRQMDLQLLKLVHKGISKRIDLIEQNAYKTTLKRLTLKGGVVWHERIPTIVQIDTTPNPANPMQTDLVAQTPLCTVKPVSKKRIVKDPDFDLQKATRRKTNAQQHVYFPALRNGGNQIVLSER